MSDRISHEFIQMPDWNFPLRIMYRETDKKSIGCAFHWHEQIEFYLVKRGGVLLTCNGEENWVYKGDIAVVNSCHPHKSVNFLDDTFHYCVQADLSILFPGPGDICYDFAQAVIQNRIVFKTFINKDKKLAAQLSRMIDEYKSRNTGCELEIKACLFNIFAMLFRKYVIKNSGSKTAGNSKGELNLVGVVLSYIAENYQSPVNLQSISEKAGISVPHMCRLFKKSTGTTIIDYVNKLRCHRAKLLLANGCNVTNAAFEVGFNDSNYFCRVYKKVFGVPPSSCR